MMRRDNPHVFVKMYRFICCYYFMCGCRIRVQLQYARRLSDAASPFGQVTDHDVGCEQKYDVGVFGRHFGLNSHLQNQSHGTHSRGPQIFFKRAPKPIKNILWCPPPRPKMCFVLREGVIIKATDLYLYIPSL